MIPADDINAADGRMTVEGVMGELAATSVTVDTAGPIVNLSDNSTATMSPRNWLLLLVVAVVLVALLRKDR